MSNPPATAQVPLGTGVLCTALGGALGAWLRWSLTSLHPVEAGHFPWATFAINLTGSAALAALVLVPAVRTRPWLALLLGTGLLGGYTTMSAASTETFALLDSGAVGLATVYALGTLAAALLAVVLVDLLTTEDSRRDFERLEADE